MKNVGEQLLKLQNIDLKLRDNKKRLSNIATALENTEPVQKAKQTVEEAEAVLKPLQKDLRDLELQVQTTKQKRESTEQRLYSGSVSNPKELQDMQQNIASLTKWQDELEEKMLELMMEIEVADDDMMQATTTLDEVMKQAEIDNQDLLTEKANLETENTTLIDKRADVINDLDSNAVELYQDLQVKMAYRPIATLTTESTCTVCGVQQTSLHAQEIRRNQGLSRCQNCNRIILAI